MPKIGFKDKEKKAGTSLRRDEASRDPPICRSTGQAII